jgi:hypothetical protein
MGLVCLLVVASGYVLSFGPVAKHYYHKPLPRVLRIFYTPLGFVCDHCRTANWLVDSYFGLWF